MKIEKIAEQAGLHLSGRVVHCTTENLTKFAELIVQECAEIADVERPSSLGCGYITKTKGMLIKQHFGVEE